MSAPAVDTRLLQEILIEQDPSGWRMLVGCVLLNQTSRRQVDGVWPALFERYESPLHLGAILEGERAEDELIELLRPLGLQNRRARTLIVLSGWWHDAVEEISNDVLNERVLAMDPPGCGEYARDSWAIFMMGFVPSWDVTDKELIKWLEADEGRLGHEWMTRELLA